MTNHPPFQILRLVSGESQKSPPALHYLLCALSLFNIPLSGVDAISVGHCASSASTDPLSVHHTPEANGGVGVASCTGLAMVTPAQSTEAPANQLLSASATAAQAKQSSNAISCYCS